MEWPLSGTLEILLGTLAHGRIIERGNFRDPGDPFRDPGPRDTNLRNIGKDRTCRQKKCLASIVFDVEHRFLTSNIDFDRDHDDLDSFRGFRVLPCII